MSASGVAVRLAALIGCCVTGLAAQEGERPRQATYELVVPRAGSRETTPLADWDRLAQGGVLLFDDESEGTVYDRLEAQLRLALTGIDEGTLELQVVERSEGALVIDAVGSEAGHAALRAALDRLQQALDAATLRFQVRLLRAAPGGEAVEVARLRARLQDGGEGGARVLRPHAWLSYEQDSSGAFPRVRPVVVPLHEGLLVSLAARRASDSSLEVHAELAYVSPGAEPTQVAWPLAGPQTLPEFVRFSCDTTLRLSAGEAVAVAERVEPDGARVWFELELLAAEAGPAQRELCLGLASDLQPGANVPWYDPLDRPQRGGGGAGAGGFSFEEEPLRSGPLELVEQLTSPPPEQLGPRLRNIVAAMVEHAAARKGVPAPHWTRTVLPLGTPWFASELVSLRAHLLRASPTAFRRRNLFVDATLGDRT